MTQNEHVYAICCRLEVAGDVISSEQAKTIERYAVLNFEVASFNSFRDIEQESPPIVGVVRNATSLIAQRLSSIILAFTCSENVHA